MLSPQNSAMALIDYQPAMYQGVQSHDRLVTFNNVQILAKAAKLFRIPTVISTVAANSFSGLFMPEVTALFPDHKVIDRTSMFTVTPTPSRRQSAAAGNKPARRFRHRRHSLRLDQARRRRGRRRRASGGRPARLSGDARRAQIAGSQPPRGGPSGQALGVMAHYQRPLRAI